MAKKKIRRVYVYQVSYFIRTKKLYDIIVLPHNAPPFHARDYHEAIKKSGIVIPNYGLCGVGWAVIGGGGDKEYDISSYRNI